MRVIELWRAWTSPSTDGELARRRESVLLSSLAGMLALSLVLQVPQLLRMATAGPEKWGWWLSNVAFGGLCFVFLRLARAGRPRAAAFGLVGIVATAAAALLVIDGTMNVVAMLLLALLVVLTAILFGAGGAVAAFAVAAAGLVAIVALQRDGALPLEPGPPLTADMHAFGDVVAMLGVLGFMLGVLWLYTRDVLLSIDEALTHSSPTSPLRQLRTRELTPREVEVAQLVAEGMTNKGIAQRLFISPRTVQSHVANGMKKAGATNRAELGALAVREGLVTPTLPETAEEPTEVGSTSEPAPARAASGNSAGAGEKGDAAQA